MNHYEQIRQLDEKIAELPAGYISEKMIHGKKRHYRQWREKGKIKSQYLREEDVEEVRRQITERKHLEQQRKELKMRFPEQLAEYKTHVVTGEELAQMVAGTRNMARRDCFYRIPQYLHGSVRTRVLVVYGLRRTGKTTMLFQAIAEMEEEDFSKAAYVKLRTTDTMRDITDDLDKLHRAGYWYVFLDEVTLMADFIDSAALFSDIYTMMGMKIVLSGTDSLGFWLAENNELYDRSRMIHTTFIPYREYSRLLGIDSIDEYIRYGGTLRMGETDFDDEELKEEGIAFRDDESTRRYIDTAICKNIQHSLACFEYGKYFGHLYELYEAGELTGAINRIIEDMNHRFVLSVLTRDFTSSDLGITARNLRNERDPEKRTDALYEIDREAVTKRLMEILEIRNREEQSVGLTQSHVAQIKKYLEALDLIVTCPLEYGTTGIEPEEKVLFTQPGMRYCQAQALVHALMKDEYFASLAETEKDRISQRLLEEVRGRMLEDIVLLETSKALGENYKVFQLRFETGEYDMVIRNKKNDTCAVYEIKHSDKLVREQARHLRNPEMLRLTSPRFGKLVGRFVLYLGEGQNMEDGIAYRNAEWFLKSLPEITLEIGLEMSDLEQEEQEEEHELEQGPTFSM